MAAQRQGVRRYFFHIKQNVSSDWKDLAYFLNFDPPSISNIDGRNRDDRSRCMDMLQEWQKKEGNAATIWVLMRALSDAGLRGVANGLTEKFPELAMQQTNQTQPGESTMPVQVTSEERQVYSHSLAYSGGAEVSGTVESVDKMRIKGAGNTTSSMITSEGPKKLFIVHAGEDKDTLVEPLVNEIVNQGVPKEHVFYDKWSIEYAQGIKDSILSTIQDSSCKLGVIVISEDMMPKYWPKREFEEFLKLGKAIFPIFYGVSPNEVRQNYSPLLADTRGVEVPRTGERVDDMLLETTASVIVKTLQDINN